MCSFPDNKLSMIKPKNLVLMILVFIELGTIIWIFFHFVFLVKNCIKCVLLQFNVKRLLWNQLVISVITELTLFLNSSGLVFDIIMLVSSANSIGLANLFMLKERSLIYRVSKEECATLRESVPYVKVYWYNPKHVYPKLNGYGDNGQRKVGVSCGSKYCNLHSWCVTWQG